MKQKGHPPVARGGLVCSFFLSRPHGGYWYRQIPTLEPAVKSSDRAVVHEVSGPRCRDSSVAGSEPSGRGYNRRVLVGLPNCPRQFAVGGRRSRSPLVGDV